MENSAERIKTAIMGGTFDPVHFGHISFAWDILGQTEISEIVFMPAKRQPFKLDVKVSSFEDRKAMLDLACSELNNELNSDLRNDHKGKRARVSSLENELDGVSYTFRTLDEYRRRRPECELYFVTGSDTFVKLDTWKEHERLLSDNSFIVGIRPGYPDKEVYEKKEEYLRLYGTRSVIIKNTPVDVSSTEIREKISAADGRGNVFSEEISEMVPRSVADYITLHGLYRDIV